MTYKSGLGVEANKAQSFSLLIDCASNADDPYHAGHVETAKAKLSAMYRDDQTTFLAALAAVPIKQLKKLLKAKQVNCSGCVEKSDLVELLQANME